MLTGSALLCCVSLVFEFACGVAFSPAPGYSRERTSPNERPDESKRHTLSGPPTRNYSSDEKVDEHSLSINTTPEEVSRSERIKEVEAEKERKSKVRGIFLDKIMKKCIKLQWISCKCNKARKSIILGFYYDSLGHCIMVIISNKYQ